MRILQLEIENVGPFDAASLEFLRPDEVEVGGVTLLTGRNGSGKTILLDAIRAFFGTEFCQLERDIRRANTRGQITVTHTFGDDDTLSVRRDGASPHHHNPYFYSGAPAYALPHAVKIGVRQPPGWVVDFWRSQLAVDAHAIQHLGTIDHRALYAGSLQGTLRNAAITELLCHFDYLRDSRTPREKATGEALYALAERIIQFSLLDGEFVGVERLTFTPRVRQGGHEVPLANVSSGNAYLVQRLIALLGRMYSLHVLRESDPATLHATPGLLLIDEAENHLHPLWQKRLIPGIRSIFPGLQIVAATHSPFVLASVPDARVYVCRYDADRQRCTVSEETAAYQNKPVDEILASPAFDETLPFGEEISGLLQRRKEAIAHGDQAMRRQVEAELLHRNPTYFAHFEIDHQLEALRRAS